MILSRLPVRLVCLRPSDVGDFYVVAGNDLFSTLSIFWPNKLSTRLFRSAGLTFSPVSIIPPDKSLGPKH